jgi:hypothetical protein
MGRIRLACMNCDRDDCDGITPAQLAQAIQSGWVDVTEEQSYERSLEEVPLDSPDRSAMEWWTHLGWCPDCGERS